ncbi:hypothetical protein [Rickettsia felis]|uniref:hypothetical protein n=1 Tax=Rickettsia felis TaxID=42862 RepID=UPI001584FD07
MFDLNKLLDRHCEQALLRGYLIVIARSEATWQSRKNNKKNSVNQNSLLDCFVNLLL